MIRFLAHTFFGTKSVYILIYPKEQFVEQLQELIDGSKGIFARVNLTGRFTDYPNAFVLNPKWSLSFIKGFEVELSYLKGAISESSLDQTQLSISVRPNIIVFLVFLISSFVGIKNVYHLILEGWSEELLVAFLFFIVFINGAVIFISRSVSKSISERFKRYFSIFSND
jgi:hypothetical protein